MFFHATAFGVATPGLRTAELFALIAAGSATTVAASSIQPTSPWTNSNRSIKAESLQGRQFIIAVVCAVCAYLLSSPTSSQWPARLAALHASSVLASWQLAALH